VGVHGNTKAVRRVAQKLLDVEDGSGGAKGGKKETAVHGTTLSWYNAAGKKRRDRGGKG